MDLNGSEQDLMEGFHKYGNKVTGLIKSEFLDHINNSAIQENFFQWNRKYIYRTWGLIHT